MGKDLQLSGFVNQNGKPMIRGLEKYNKFFSTHPGKDFLLNIEVFEKGSVDRHVWYIIKNVLPAFVRGYTDKGMLINRKQAFEFIIDICPIFDGLKPDEVFCWKNWKVTCKLSVDELTAAIEFLHCYCVDQFCEVVGNIRGL